MTILNSTGWRSISIILTENAHPRQDRLEAQANEFANELLAPGELLKKLRPTSEHRHRDTNDEAFHRPFATLAKRTKRRSSTLTEKQLADLFEVSEQVIFIALTRYKLL